MTPIQKKLMQLLLEYLRCDSTDGRPARQQMRKDLWEQLRAVNGEDAVPKPRPVLRLPARQNIHIYQEGDGGQSMESEVCADGTWMNADAVIEAGEKAGCLVIVAEDRPGPGWVTYVG